MASTAVLDGGFVYTCLFEGFFLGAKGVGHVIWRVGGTAARVCVMGFAILPMLYDPQQLWLLICFLSVSRIPWQGWTLSYS